MANESSYILAMDYLCTHPLIERLVKPYYNRECETVRFRDINYGVLSGGEKAALSWAYGIWTNEMPPKGWRDPFEGFGVMSEDLQKIIIEAMALRNGLR